MASRSSGASGRSLRRAVSISASFARPKSTACHELLHRVLRGQSPHGAVVRAGQPPGRRSPYSRLAYTLLVEQVFWIVGEMHQGRREEGVPRAGGVHDLDLEGRYAAAELPGGVESPLRAQAHQYQLYSAADQALRRFLDTLNPEQRRQLLVSQLDDGGEVEQRVHGLAGDLDARPEVFAEVDVEGRRDVQVLREFRGLVDGRAAGVFYEEYAPEVDERGS